MIVIPYPSVCIGYDPRKSPQPHKERKSYWERAVEIPNLKRDEKADLQ